MNAIVSQKLPCLMRDIPIYSDGKNSFILCPTAYGVLYDLSFDSLANKKAPKATATQFSISNSSDNASYISSKRRRLRSETPEENDITLKVGESIEVEDFETLNDLRNSSLSLEDFPQLTLVVPSMISEVDSVPGDDEARKQRLLQLTCRIEAVDEVMPTPSF